MRHLVLAALLLATACTPVREVWRPTPIPNAIEPSDVVAHSAAEDWRPIADEDLLVIELADGGTVYVELAPEFAPVHVANIRAFARGGWWNDATVYRVQEN